MDLFQKLSKRNEMTEELLAKVQIFKNDQYTAQIKPEFLLLEHKYPPNKVEEASESVAANGVKHELEEDGSENQTEAKRLKPSELRSEVKSQKKQKSRSNDSKVCPSVAKCIACVYGDKCRYSHDVKQWFLESKPKDIDTDCYLYELYGYCPFGLTCRFCSKHVELKDDGTFQNLKNEEKFKESNKTVRIYNVLAYELKQRLWKKKYDFKPSKTVYDLVDKYVHSRSNYKYNPNKGIVKKTTPDDANKTEAVEGEQEPEPKKVGCVTDEDLIKLRTSEKKKIDWKNKLYLAPLTTVGNLPYRRICKEFGADITCSEMAMAMNLLNGQASEFALLKRHESEDLFGVQLAGSYADTMTKACQIIKDNNFNVDFIDINSGCPIDLVFNKGAGCALMTRLEHYEKIIRSLDTLMDIPITAKVRTGIKEDLLVTHDLIPQMKTWGVSMITLHGRTKNQRYSKLADWSYIDKCAQLSDPIPLFGCGDILSHHDYYEHMENTKISGCMLARGALYKPWLFTEIKERRDWDISAAERFDILKKYANYGLEHWGSDSQGVETTRRFMLEWLSFLYRYIPIGILEQVPQCINQRPPAFFCRNDLETLLASPNCSDWIKISEMLLGPVGEGFQFNPKHKANSY